MAHLLEVGQPDRHFLAAHPPSPTGVQLAGTALAGPAVQLILPAAAAGTPLPLILVDSYLQDLWDLKPAAGFLVIEGFEQASSAALMGSPCV